MNEEMRKEFECFVVSGELLPDLFVNRISYANRLKMVSDCFNGIAYSNDALQLSFKAFAIGWKASREAMKPIKLPDSTFETPSGDSALREAAVYEAIEQAGYKVAP